MSAAPEMKYTDRDVREDPDLTQLAIAYIANYTGEFDPLVEAKELFEEYGELTTPMIRKVLNCMRHDAQVVMQLPRPKYGSNVVAFQPPKRRVGSRPKNDKQSCQNTDSHDKHWWGEWGEHECQGMPWAINRFTVYLPVKVKVKYAMSRTGKLIHTVDPAYEHTMAWNPPRHSWGFRTQVKSYYSTDAELTVKTLCRFPSYLRRPVLIKEELLEQILSHPINLVEFPGIREMQMCPHCEKLRG